MRPAAAPLIMCMHVCLGGEGIIYYYPHPAWGGLFEMENGLLFLFFLSPYIILERIVFDFI